MREKFVKADYDKKLTALNDVIVIRKLEDYHERKYGDIIIPQHIEIGFNLTKDIVESVGKDARSQGIKAGDLVLYDHFGGFYLTHPIVTVKMENIIAKIHE